jgi:hypothetical protein
MDKGGKWIATRKGAPGWRGYHLPSMYSISMETTFGQMAKRFLLARQSVQGLQDFINGDLAEPYVAQDIQGRKDTASRIEVGAEWHKIMSVDVQQKAPLFWFVKRAWSGDQCVGLRGGSLDSWDDVHAVQNAVGEEVKNTGVVIDCGFGSMENSGVYRECAEHCTFEFNEKLQKGYGVGWTPAKSYGGTRQWTRVNKDTGETIPMPYIVRPDDPFKGTLRANRVLIDMFEFNRNVFLDVLERLRSNEFPGLRWIVSPELLTEEYRKHMNGIVKKQKVKYGAIIDEWVSRSRQWPDHMMTCEVQGIALAASFGLFPLTLKDVKQ